MTHPIRSVLSLFVGLFAVFLFAGPAVAEDVWVEGKYRRDGVYVPGHYRSGPDRHPIDTTKPYRIPNDERTRGRLYDGDNSFGNEALFGRGNRSNGRSSRLGD
jgi:hypothetical protein